MSLKNGGQIQVGEIQAERTAPESESDVQPGMLFVSNFKENAILLGGEMWFHSDQCYFNLPVSATSLYAIELPSVGGQILFRDFYKPYEDLLDDIKAKLVGRVVLNVYDYQSNNRYMKSTERTKGAPSAVHPVVRTHPETGRKSLFINRLMTDYTLDMDTAESTELRSTISSRVNTSTTILGSQAIFLSGTIAALCMRALTLISTSAVY